MNDAANRLRRDFDPAAKVTITHELLAAYQMAVTELNDSLDGRVFSPSEHDLELVKLLDEVDAAEQRAGVEFIPQFRP
jgi:hypothetical protein